MMRRAQIDAAEELLKLCKQGGDRQKRFVIYEDLVVWWDRNLKFFNEETGLSLTPRELQQVQGFQLKILSTLVIVGWEDMRSFRRLFVRPKLYDTELPLFSSDAKLSALSAIRRAQFEEDQYMFMPVKFGPANGPVVSYTKEQRMPFVEPSEEIDKGSFGSVTKEVIAMRHLVHAGNLDDDIVVARKEIDERWASTEIKNLQHVQSSLLSHDRIVQHLAMYRLGESYHIIFPLANTNLAKLISLPEYEKQFPAPACITKFMSEAAILAGALDYLHTSLESPGEKGSICCHMDLKTDNILVFFTEDAFHWKITDLGISRIKPDPKRPATLGEIMKQSTSRTMGRRPPGEFQAPEMNMRNKVGRSSDIWSLGCIIIKVMIRGTMGVSALHEFDNDKFTEDDYFYEGRELKHSVQVWLDKFHEENGSYTKVLGSKLRIEQSKLSLILDEFHELISKALNQDDRYRPDTTTMKNKLATIARTLHNTDTSSIPACSHGDMNISRSGIPSTNATKRIEAIDRLRSHYSWFEPGRFRPEALNFKTSPVLSKAIKEWLMPDSIVPVFVLREPFRGGSAVSKVTSCLCATDMAPDLNVIPCFTLKSPGRIGTPSKQNTFLDLLVGIIAGLIPKEKMRNNTEQDALDFELLRQRNRNEAHGFAFKTISDLLEQSRGRTLLLIDEFSTYYENTEGQANDRWQQLLSIMTRYHDPAQRTVRTLIRTFVGHEIFKSDGLQQKMIANSSSGGTVLLMKLVRENFIEPKTPQ